MGLAHLSYPRSWNNIERCDLHVTSPGDQPGQLKTIGVVFPGGRYRSAGHIINVINDCIDAALSENIKKKVRVSLESESDRVKVSLLSQELGLEFHPKLSVVLGLTEGRACRILRQSTYKALPPIYQDSVTLVNRITIGSHHVNPNRLMPSIYLYSDLASYQTVGDVSAPLLRILPQPDFDGASEQVSESFAKILYAPMAVTSFSSIELHLTDHLGVDIDFRYGVLTAQLHIRRCR